MISVDSKEVDNINNKIEYLNIDEVNKIIVKNKDMISSEEAISIDNKKGMKIRTDIEEKSLAIPKESFEIEVKEKADIINNDVVEEMKSSDTNIKSGYHGDSKENFKNNKSKYSKYSSYHEDNNIISKIQETALIKALDEKRYNKIKNNDD